MTCVRFCLLLASIVGMVLSQGNITGIISDEIVGSYSATATVNPTQCHICSAITTRASLSIQPKVIMINYAATRKNDACAIPTSKLILSVSKVHGNYTHGTLKVDDKAIGRRCVLLTKHNGVIQLVIDYSSTLCPTNTDVVCLQHGIGSIESRTLFVETRDQQFWLVIVVGVVFAVPTIAIPLIVILIMFICQRVRHQPFYSRLTENNF